MVLVEPTQPRYTVDDLPGQLVVTMRPRRNWFAILFAGFWLLAWLVGEVVVSGALAAGLVAALQNGFQIGVEQWVVGGFLLAWLGGWTVGGAVAVYAWLWNLAGREIVSISENILSIERRVPLWGRIKEYRMADVSSLRVAQRTFSIWDQANYAQFRGDSRGMLAFDYGAGTIRFGTGIEEAEAKRILGEIAKKYPRFVEQDPGWRIP
jgi:hypothetical protein